MKTVTTHLLIAIAVLTSLLMYGQNPPPADAPQVVPSTPNAMKITEYYAQRPNLYTGTANISVPLYTIDFEGWKLPLLISYNATGIRTNEEASEVGLGWALNATGTISRTVNGSDDLFQGPSGGSGRKGYVYDDVPLTFQMGYNWEKDTVPPVSSYYSRLVQRQPDTQPDIFNYNFFGLSGSFVLTQKVSGPIRAVKLTQDACSILYNEQQNSFTVITPQGFKGTFDVRERSTSTVSYVRDGVTVSNWLTCCDENYIDPKYLKESSGQFRVITSWYLSRIESPHGKIISFSYDLDLTGNSPNVSLSKGFAEFASPVSSRLCMQTVQEHIYLKSIASDEVKLDFVMETRDDLRTNTLYTKDKNSFNPFPVPSKLKRFKRIHVVGLDRHSTLDKSISFEQSYFNQSYHNRLTDDENEVRWLRSRLDRVKVDDQEYMFFYEQPNGLPDKLTTAVDHFGFYNGIEQVARKLLPPDPISGTLISMSTNLADTSIVQVYRQRVSRTPNFGFGRCGLLTKVIYPTRGYSVFEYEAHRYLPDLTIPFHEALISNSGNLAGGARIKSIKDFDFNDSLAMYKEYRYQDDIHSMTTTCTGRLMTPLHNRYAAKYRNKNEAGFTFQYKSHAGIPGGASAQGKIIGYSKVHEVVHGRNSYYWNTYYYENRPNRVSAYNAVALGWPNLNGQLIKVENFDNNGKLVRQTVNDNYYNKEADKVKGIVYEPQPSDVFLNPFLNYFVPYELERTFVTPGQVTSSLASTTDGAMKQTRTMSTFNPNYLLKTVDVLSSKGEVLRTEYRRPSDYVSPSPALTQMRDPAVNIVEPVIETIVTRDGRQISATASRYWLNTNLKPDLLQTYSWNRSLGKFKPSGDGNFFPPPYEATANYRYDIDGRLLEYANRDGVTNSVVWGYNNKLPVVHGLAVGFDALSEAYKSSATSSNPEHAIRTHAYTSGKQVTTFSHIPLVGVSTITSPDEILKTFGYDQLERLKSVVDGEGKTLEQHQYHFRERKLTRTLSIPLALDFGIQIQDFFKPTFYEYEKCGSAVRTLTLSNVGEDTVNVSRLEFPSGYSSTWTGGTIFPGTDVNVNVRFNAGYNLQPGLYNGILKVYSNATQAVASVTVTGSMSSRICKLTTPETTLDFGQTISSIMSKGLTVTNAGNGTLKIIDTPLTVDGTTGKVEYFQIDPNPVCLEPGGAQQYNVAFKPPSDGFYSAVVSLVTDASCPNTFVNIKARKRPAAEARMISISQAPLMQINMESMVTSTLYITNPGVYTLHVAGMSTNVVDNTISLSESKFDIDPGQQKLVVVTFKPGASDFNLHQVQYTFQADQTSGVNTFVISGRRNEVKKVSVSIPSLTFSYANQAPQAVTITNVGNQDLFFTDDGISFAYPNASGGYSAPEGTSIYWSANVSNVAQVLHPGQSTQLNVRLLPGYSAPLRQFVRIDYGKSAGVADTYVELVAYTKVLGYPSTVSMQSTDAVISRTVSFYNYGNTTITVKGYSSSNVKFAIPSAQLPATIPPFGGKTDLTVNYTPSDFLLNTTTLALDCDATGFQSNISNMTINGTRTKLLRLDALRPDNNTGDWNIKYSQPTKTGSLKNSGNVPLTINCINVSDTNPNVDEFRVTFPSGTTFPMTLSPGATLFITLTSNNSYSTTASGSIVVTYESNQIISINVQRVLY
jgi:hypothetical protein